MLSAPETDAASEMGAVKGWAGTARARMRSLRRLKLRSRRGAWPDRGRVIVRACGRIRASRSPAAARFVCHSHTNMPGATLYCSLDVSPHSNILCYSRCLEGCMPGAALYCCTRCRQSTQTGQEKRSRSGMREKAMLGLQAKVEPGAAILR